MDFLGVLDAENSSLSGSLPNSLPLQMPRLYGLQLGGNQLTGAACWIVNLMLTLAA